MAATAAAKVDTGGVDRPLLVCVSYARTVWPVREAKVSVRMRNTITVMNAKGGVGKSTLVLALAETLATYHGKRVLVIDADAQASVSHMLARAPELEAAQSGERTIVDYLIAAVLRDAAPSWQDFVIPDVSDVDDARSIALIASDTDLTLFEREVSKGDHEAALRRSVGALLAEAGQKYDLVLVDSAPGLSVLTECFLREAHFYMSPTRPDEISIRGLGFLREFKQRNPEMGFGNNLGVIINMKDMLSPRDEEVDRWLRRDPEHHCFHEFDPARDAPAGDRGDRAADPLLLGQVPRRDRRLPAPPHARAAPPPRIGARRCSCDGRSRAHGDGRGGGQARRGQDARDVVDLEGAQDDRLTDLPAPAGGAKPPAPRKSARTLHSVVAIAGVSA